MRNRIWSRLIPLVEAVPPNQFRLSPEFLAVAGPFWSEPDELREFVTRVVTACDPSGQSLFIAVPGSPELFTVTPLVSRWCRAVQEAKLQTMRIPAVLVQEAKRTRLLQRYDVSRAAVELTRLMAGKPGAPDAVVDAVRECTDQRPSAERWTQLEHAVTAALAGGWLSPDDVRMALRRAEDGVS